MEKKKKAPYVNPNAIVNQWGKCKECGHVHQRGDKERCNPKKAAYKALITKRAQELSPENSTDCAYLAEMAYYCHMAIGELYATTDYPRRGIAFEAYQKYDGDKAFQAMRKFQAKKREQG